VGPDDCIEIAACCALIRVACALQLSFHCCRTLRAMSDVSLHVLLLSQTQRAHGHLVGLLLVLGHLFLV